MTNTLYSPTRKRGVVSDVLTPEALQAYAAFIESIEWLVQCAHDGRCLSRSKPRACVYEHSQEYHQTHHFLREDTAPAASIPPAERGYYRLTLK